MAYSFPLSLAEFQDIINVAAAPFRLQRSEEYSGLSSGQILADEMAPPLWSAPVRLFPAFHDDGLETQALIDTLDGSMQSFLFYDPRAAFPRHDPDGTLLGAATPTVHSLGADNKSIRIEGLPAGYRLSRGDMFALRYGADPERRSLHRLSVPVEAGGTGQTPLFEFRPHLETGAAAGAAVELIKPAAYMRIMPGSLSVSEADDFGTVSIAFTAIQRLVP